MTNGATLRCLSIPSFLPYLSSSSHSLLDFIRALVAIARGRACHKKKKNKKLPGTATVLHLIFIRVPNRPILRASSFRDARLSSRIHASFPFSHPSRFCPPLFSFYSANKRISTRFPINYTRNIRRGRRSPCIFHPNSQSGTL